MSDLPHISLPARLIVSLCPKAHIVHVELAEIFELTADSQEHIFLLHKSLLFLSEISLENQKQRAQHSQPLSLTASQVGEESVLKMYYTCHVFDKLWCCHGWNGGGGSSSLKYLSFYFSL